MTTNETNISSTTPKQNRGLIKKTILFGLLGLFLFSFLEAHGGRTNRAGCHNEKKTGGYHCHNDNTNDNTNDNSTNK